MTWDRAVFFLLLCFTALLALQAALNPSPPARQAAVLIAQAQRELTVIQRLCNQTFRDPWEAHLALAQIGEVTESLQARLGHLEATLTHLFCTTPAVVFRADGEDIVVTVVNVKAGGLAVGTGGPALRYDPAQWSPVELQPARGWHLVCGEIGS
ncbi:MAG: hypothetical protein ABDI20_04895, partial [Candidatus Bipolaricaulaceae bacterium]